MASLEEGTWHESHVVWHFPPSNTWHMANGAYERHMENRKVRESLLLLEQTKKKKKQFGGWKKEKEKKEKRRKRKRKERK